METNCRMYGHFLRMSNIPIIDVWKNTYIHNVIESDVIIYIHGRETRMVD